MIGSVLGIQLKPCSTSMGVHFDLKDSAVVLRKDFCLSKVRMLQESGIHEINPSIIISSFNILAKIDGNPIIICFFVTDGIYRLSECNYQVQRMLIGIIALGLLAMLARSRPVVVNGGEVTINGAVTDTQIDIMVNYSANVKWLAVIFSKDEVNTDLHLLEVDETNAALPVKVRDCYLDQNSHIVYDDVNSIQPSVTSFTGDISYGLKIAYNRDLNTNDLEDKRFYPNDVIQVCFMSSGIQFVGGGFEAGNQKICSFFSLHTNFEYWQDRLLGNWAATSLFGGGNLTVYATQSTDQGTFQSWLFLGIVHKQQGLTPYDGRWIGVTYQDSLSNTDLTVMEYAYRDFLTEVHILDMYITNSSYAADDYDYPDLQGGDDITQNLGGVDEDQYMVGLYKRKFLTGDNNRDIDISAGENTFCFLLGDAFAFTDFTFEERICLNLNLATSYYSNFRVSEEEGQSVIEYQEPTNNVVVIKFEGILRVCLAFTMMIYLMF